MFVLDCKIIYILLKVDPVHAMKPYEVEQKCSTTCSYPLRYMEVNGQVHTPTAVYAQERTHTAQDDEWTL